jgi:ribonuclease-3
MQAEPSLLEVKIGYRFRDPVWLHRALTHRSFANEARPGAATTSGDNEQLEFLGDSILGFLVAEALVTRYPESREGDLSRMKAHLVSAAHLHGVARHVDLGSYLALGRSEEMSGGRSKKTLLVDGLEALLAAMYLDGGIEPVRAFVNAWVLDAPPDAEEEIDTEIHPALTNFKSALQELAQARHMPQPRYIILREHGPEHAKLFTLEARVGKEWSAQADGRTKKLAAQRAARTLFDRMRRETGANEEAAGPGAGAVIPRENDPEGIAAS